MGPCGPMESPSRRRFPAQIPEPEAALPGSRHLSQRRLPIRCPWGELCDRASGRCNILRFEHQDLSVRSANPRGEQACELLKGII